MKKVLALFVGIMLWGMAVTAQAVPMYYTFDGTVSSIGDGTGIIADAGLAVGSPVSYTFLVDFDADGIVTRNNGVYTPTDNPVFDYFYTDYISGSALQQKDGGYYNGSWNIVEYNYGYEFSGLAMGGYLFGNSRDDHLQISSSSMYVYEWAVGSAVTGYNSAYDSAGAYSYSHLDANLTLTGISAAAPVPEPATMLLFGSGLLGMFGFKRKKYSKS